MKPLRFILAAAATISLSAFYSCGGAGSQPSHATQIALPDSALVGKSLPAIDGSLAAYGSVVALPYSINLTDSILSLNIEFAVKGGAQFAAFQTPVIAGQSLVLQLTDSVGKAITGFRMNADAAAIDSLNAALAANRPDTLVIRLTEAAPLTTEMRDSLAKVARNMQISAKVELAVDSKKIDEALDAYEKQAKSYSSMHFTYMDSFNRYPVLRDHTDRLHAAKHRATQYQKYMTPEQQARLKKIHGSYKEIYWD